MGGASAATNQAVLDFGRNRVFAAVEHLLELDAPHAGLVVRWRHPGGCDRLTDRVMELVMDHPDHAAQLVADLVGAIKPRLSAPLRCVAIPPAMGARSRAAVLAGLAAAGLGVQVALVDRPIGALAGWLHSRKVLGGNGSHGAILVIDNDGGEVSILGAHLQSKRLLAVEPLSLGPDDDPGEVAIRLQDFATRTISSIDHDSAGPERRWVDVSSSFDTIVTSGSGRDHPTFKELIAGLFPATPIAHDRMVKHPSEAVVSGLVYLDTLQEFRCGWPTAEIRTDERVLRAPGPINPSDGESMTIHATNELWIGNNLVGTIPGGGDLDVMFDGRLVLRSVGASEVVEVSWEVPGLGSASALRSRSNPEPVDHIEPELGGHP